VGRAASKEKVIPKKDTCRVQIEKALFLKCHIVVTAVKLIY
jgi:hypothetical protein